ncbi:MAG: hypothetical protein A3G18_04085 [Rhodospirillales bacterium RIFCSPLOWO2_12_FULL_58_28]|nr:MAG: hypothetical protein A3H92_04965 [Rhodospirillales bacterium RIFCSPLOWO2_02_FULL_58_16]OHC78701.1 MAG: hypothetical protein A3G18_04085 [Rhodospirillales bacterium RIFCSPLOWO2_12_FULL_58_28]
MNGEITLEFHFKPEDLQRLRALPVIKRSTVKRPYTRCLSGVYFDTPGRLLRKNHITLGIYKSGRRHIQCVTSEETRVGGIVVHDRCENHILTETPDPSAVENNDLRRLVGRLGRNRMKEVFRVEFRRTTYRLDLGDGGEATFDLDSGEIIAGNVREPLNEAHLTLTAGAPGQLLDLVLEILSAVQLRVAVAGRTDRGFAMVEGRGPGWRKNVRLDLSEGATFEDAMVHTVHHCLKHMLANETHVLESEDPEGVHQMRVALRRLLSALRLFRSVLPPDRRRHIVGEAKWIIDQLAGTRDWDVFLDEIAAPAIANSDNKDQFSALIERTTAQRERCRKVSRQAILSERYTRFLLLVGTWTARRAWRDQPAPEASALLFSPVINLSDNLINAGHGKVTDKGRRFNKLTVAERHKLRIQVKKLRYAVDFFSSLYPHDRIQPYAAMLAKLQDSLGYYNDVAVAETLVSRLVAECGDDKDNALQCQRAGGIVIGWHTHILALSVETLKKDLGNFIKAKRFWS